ncbi:MAG: hypothetical protein JXR73_19975 [Candidatus Omnitrophica bacterium]|nr:hypothetical protein [Candidatus Omnitrophota bacterium]
MAQSKVVQGTNGERVVMSQSEATLYAELQKISSDVSHSRETLGKVEKRVDDLSEKHEDLVERVHSIDKALSVKTAIAESSTKENTTFRQRVIWVMLSVLISTVFGATFSYAFLK